MKTSLGGKLYDKAAPKEVDLPGIPWGIPDAFPIRLMHNFSQPARGLHVHDYMELLVILGGMAEHITPTDRYPISTGNVFLLQPNDVHGFDNTDDLLIANVCIREPEIPFFRDAFLATIPGFHSLFRLEPHYRKAHQGESRLRLSSQQLARLRGMLDRLYHELEQRPTGYAFVAITILQDLVAYLSRCYSEPVTPQGRSIQRIAEAISYIEHHYQENVTLGGIATASRMSKSNLIKCFRESLGMPPIEYLIQTRIRNAMRLLRQSGSTITEIAYAVGFNDSNYFSRQFKQQTGLSPRVYRFRSLTG